MGFLLIEEIPLARILSLLTLVVVLCACSKTPAGATTASAATPSPQAGAAPPAGALLGAQPPKPVPAQIPDVPVQFDIANNANVKKLQGYYDL